MDIETKAGLVIPTKISRCLDCPDNEACPLNNFVELLKDSRASKISDLDTIATQAELTDRSEYNETSGTDKGKHVVYQCNGTESNSTGSGYVDLLLVTKAT